MRVLGLLVVLGAARLSAQVRGVELFQLMNREALTRTTGTTRLQWIPGGGYLESSTDSATGRRVFYRVDPLSQKRTRLFDDTVVANLIAEYNKALGADVKDLPFTTFTWEQGGQAISWAGGSGRFVYDLGRGGHPGGHDARPYGRGGLPGRPPQPLRQLKPPARTGPLDESALAPGAWSPDYNWFAFVRDYDNLWLYDPATGTEERLGRGSSENNLIGFLEVGPWYVWSPDSRYIAYVTAAQSGSPYPITKSVPRRATVEYFKYPFTTDSTPKLELWVASIATRKSVKVTETTPENAFIRDIIWLPGSAEVTFQRYDRWISRRELMAADPATGKARTLLVDADSTFLNPERNFRVLADGKRFLWSSERSGWRHIYLYDLSGRELKQLTSGEWETTDILRVDEAAGWVYFTASASLGLERGVLHRVKLDGTGLARLTPDAGTHNVALDSTGKFFTDDWSSLRTPRTVVLRSTDGKLVRELASTAVTRVAELGLQPPELLTLTGADGSRLSGVLFKPADFDPAKKYPVIVSVYGGPHSKQVRDTYSTTEFRARLAQLGFLVAEFDARGTPYRGKKFQAGNYLKLGQADVDDQAAAMRELARRPYVDGARVGVTGISHGGYMTIMMLLRYPDVFQVGVAGAPITDLRNGPRLYIGRVMRTPEANPDGYAKGDAVALAGTLKGRLLIHHGTNDRNAVIGNAMQFARKAIDAGRPLDMMIYPDGVHVLTGRDAVHGMKTTIAYFLEHLRPTDWERSLATIWAP
jgi:dipeptidyl-peptidase-4